MEWPPESLPLRREIVIFRPSRGEVAEWLKALPC
jgi:hypothetical protein